MFGFGKKKVIGSKLIRFLDEADDAYMLAFKSKNVKPLMPYCCNSLCSGLLEKIMDGREVNFGVDKYRLRTWDVRETTNAGMVVLKEVTHENIKIGKGIDIALGDTVRQLWYVDTVANKYQVKRIEVA